MVCCSRVADKENGPPGDLAAELFDATEGVAVVIGMIIHSEKSLVRTTQGPEQQLECRVATAMLTRPSQSSG
jgi:hypothetical protein